MKVKKIIFGIFCTLFLFSASFVFSDDDGDDGDDFSFDYSGPDMGDMDNWTDDDWDAFFDYHSDDPDGWDGTSSTYGQDANDWHADDVPDDATPYDYDNNVVVMDGDGNLISIGLDDVYDEYGNFIFSYQGPAEDKEAVEARVAEFFEGKLAEKASDTLSAYIAALALLNEARRSGADEKTLAELEAKVSELHDQLDVICSSLGFSWQISQNQNFGVITNREGKIIYHAGDPVIFATGEFIIDDEDLFASGKGASFAIQRHYSSGVHAQYYKKYGFFGQGWTSNLETRIIPCYSDDFINAAASWPAYIEKLKKYKEDIAQIANSDSDAEGVYETMQKLYAEKCAEYDVIKQYAEESEEKKNFCTYVDYGFPGKYANNGMDTFIYVQDNGGIIVFREDSEGEISIASPAKNCKVSLSISDDEYCIYYPVTGERRYYSEFGLPIRFTYKNGGKVEFVYNNQNKIASILVDGNKSFSLTWAGERLSSIVNEKNDRKVSYSYTDEKLTKITDWEGDSKQFAYNSDGLISRQIKADGSFVAFEFEEIDGMMRTVKTTNEEGKSEYFEYDTENQELVYKNYDGEQSIFVYDEKGRTIYAEYPDGHFIRYEYDESNNLLSKTENLGKITLTYDSNGNLIQKIYPDNSSEKWTYNNNLLTSFTDRDGISQHYFYNSEGLMTDIYRASKLYLHFDYNSDGQVSAIMDCSGNTTNYKYDSNGNLIEKSLGKKIEKWKYDSKNRPLSYTDALGRKTSYSYDSHSTKMETSEGLAIEEVYSERKLLLSKTLSDSRTGEKRTISYEYDKNKNCVAQYISGIDSNGKKIPKTRLYDFSYTDSGYNSAIIEYDVFSESKHWISEFEYSTNGNIYSAKTGFLDAKNAGFGAKSSIYLRNYFENALVSSVQNADGRIQFEKYDFDGRLISTEENGIQKNLYSYTNAGRLLKEKNGKSGSYVYAYDSEFGFKTGFSEENGTLKSFDHAFYLPDGRIESYIDRNGEKTQYFYDEFKNVIKIVSSRGVKEFEYDLCGRLISSVQKNSLGTVVQKDSWNYDDRKITHISGETYSEISYFNAFGEMIVWEDGNGNKKSYVYDILGRMISEKDAYSLQTFYTYNGRNQLTKILFNDGTFLQYEYDESGNCVCARDIDGKIWEKTFDSSNRVKSYSERPFSCIEYYEYDEFDDLISVTKNNTAAKKSKFSLDGKVCEDVDSLGNKNSFTYDGFGRLRSWKNAHGKISETNYALDGKINFIKDFNGSTKKYSYSKNGLISEISCSDGEKITYEYDIAGNLLRATNSSCDLRFFYDIGGMLVRQKNLTDGTEISYSYDSAKNLVKMTSSERSVSYLWGKTGELLSISDEKRSENTLLSMRIRFVYDNMGRETLRVYDSGESMKSTYDKEGRLILQLGYDSNINLVFVDGSAYNKNDQKIYSLNSDFSVTRYEYDDFGRLVSVSYPYSDEMAEKMKAFAGEAGLFHISGSANSSILSLSASDYDLLQKLCSQIGFVSYQIAANESVLTEQFFYDSNNNIIKRVSPYATIDYSYDSENRLVLWGDGCKADYDENGNMIYKKTAYSETFYEYNSFDRLQKALVIDVLEDSRYERKHTYDALGRRYLSWLSEEGSHILSYIGLSLQMYDSKKVFSDIVEYSSNSKNRIASSTSNQPGRYVFIDDDSALENRSLTPIANESAYGILPLYDVSGNLLSYFSVGNSYGEEKSVVMADKTGTIKTELSDNRGTIQFKYDAFGSPISECASFAFIGKKFDDKLEAYDFGFRDYEPKNARFSSVDPIHDGLNWYAYCDGNPIEFYDMYGLEAIEVEEQYMQDMGGARLGMSGYNFTTDKNGNFIVSAESRADREGCVVTAIAEALTAFTGIDISNSYINSHGECFNGDNISWAAIADSFGLGHSVEFSAGSNVSSRTTPTGVISSKTGDATFANCVAIIEDFKNGNAKTALVDEINIKSTLGNIENSSKAVAVIAQVGYGVYQNSKGENYVALHFVGISTEVTQINGKSYVAITATSKYDTAKSLGSNRINLGWVVKDGKVFVPLTLVNRIDTLSKPS